MQIEIPKEIEGLVTEKAHRAGYESVSEYVVGLVLGGAMGQGQSATIDDARHGNGESGHLVWNDELNERRCELIDKDIQGALGDDERRELDTLTERFREYRRHVAPLPMNGPRRLHADLVEKKRRQEEDSSG